jgi:hypothetical protein
MINEAAINYLIQGWLIKTELKTQPSTHMPQIFVADKKKTQNVVHRIKSYNLNHRNFLLNKQENPTFHEIQLIFLRLKHIS